MVGRSHLETEIGKDLGLLAWFVQTYIQVILYLQSTTCSLSDTGPFHRGIHLSSVADEQIVSSALSVALGDFFIWPGSDGFTLAICFHWDRTRPAMDGEGAGEHSHHNTFLPEL
ncbi:hypothetical protein EYF80_015609 [Liparis tanakae]|uniref:Uncharacterized protein n=1 Tax=Liparis tanakae TaxID=230148 RepID=A0A4Z2IA23_9TELE|nr:hypothetical protein EYF80_015609 [Liparis tanakae]